ncbi:SDR family NAD(P)-dependent oxidoreductase [archaeon]|nr:MAG: SDR family NAD(P)-dependent oxidoreductase [archaeon]
MATPQSKTRKTSICFFIPSRFRELIFTEEEGKRMAFSPNPLSIRRAVVVGGTSGIGEGIAKRLAKEQLAVTIVGRSATRGQEITKELHDLGGSNHEFIQCDAFQMRNVVEVSKQIKEKYGQDLHYLVLTQGMATIQGRTETSEGLDQKLALHYFGRMCFVRELLPVMLSNTSTNGPETGVSTKVIMSVLSGGVHGPYDSCKNDFELKSQYTLGNAANAAGYYNDLYLDKLGEQQGGKPVAFYHAAPGMVRTNWGTEMPWYIKYPIRFMQSYLPFFKTQEQCAELLCRPLFEVDRVVGDSKNKFVVINEDGSVGKKTSQHSQEEVDFVFEKTNELLDSILGRK